MAEKTFEFTLTDNNGKVLGKWRAPFLPEEGIDTRIPAHLGVKIQPADVYHVTWCEVGTLQWEDE